MLYVTGITGHTGKWFLNRLIEENYQGKVRCLVREESDTTLLDQSGLDVEKVYGSLNDKAFLESSLAGIETIIHIASIHYSDHLIDAAIQNGVKWAILVHTTGRYSKYKSASAQYIETEDRILNKRSQIGITVLRPTMIYGSSLDRNMYKLVEYLDRHRFFPMFGKGANLMQPVHARDLGNAYYDVFVNRQITFNKAYNLSGKEPLPYKELVRTVSNRLNKKTIMIHFPLWFSVLAAKVYNKINKHAVISVEQVLRMQEDKAFSWQDAAEDFGYAPMSFAEGIVEEVEAYLLETGENK